MHKMKSKSLWKEIVSHIQLQDLGWRVKVVASVTKITVGKNEKWVVLIFVVTEELVRIIMEYVCFFFRIINFTWRCNTKGRILTSVTKNLSGLYNMG